MAEDRFQALETDFRVARDTKLGINYHLATPLEAAGIVEELNSLELRIVQLTARVAELQEELFDTKVQLDLELNLDGIEDEDTATSRIFSEENLVKDTDDFSDFPNEVPMAEGPQHHG